MVRTKRRDGGGPKSSRPEVKIVRSFVGGPVRDCPSSCTGPGTVSSTSRFFDRRTRDPTDVSVCLSPWKTVYNHFTELPFKLTRVQR